MKRYLKKATRLLLAVSLLVVAFAVPTSASLERSSLYLDCYRAWLTPQSGGKINITIDVQAVDYMDNVGALTVEMYEVGDVKHYIMSDVMQRKVSWRNGNWECHISGNLSRDDLLLMIDSIYE